MNKLIKTLYLSSIAFLCTDITDLKASSKVLSPEEISRGMRNNLSKGIVFDSNKIKESVEKKQTTWAESFIRFAIELCLQSVNKNEAEQKKALEHGNNLFAKMIAVSSPLKALSKKIEVPKNSNTLVSNDEKINDALEYWELLCGKNNAKGFEEFKKELNPDNFTWFKQNKPYFDAVKWYVLNELGLQVGDPDYANSVRKSFKGDLEEISTKYATHQSLNDVTINDNNASHHEPTIEELKAWWCKKLIKAGSPEEYVGEIVNQIFEPKDALANIKEEYYKDHPRPQSRPQTMSKKRMAKPNPSYEVKVSEEEKKAIQWYVEEHNKIGERVNVSSLSTNDIDDIISQYVEYVSNTQEEEQKKISAAKGPPTGFLKEILDSGKVDLAIKECCESSELSRELITSLCEEKNIHTIYYFMQALLKASDDSNIDCRALSNELVAAKDTSFNFLIYPKTPDSFIKSLEKMQRIQRYAEDENINVYRFFINGTLRRYLKLFDEYFNENVVSDKKIVVTEKFIDDSKNLSPLHVIDNLWNLADLNRLVEYTKYFICTFGNAKSDNDLMTNLEKDFNKLREKISKINKEKINNTEELHVIQEEPMEEEIN